MMQRKDNTDYPFSESNRVVFDVLLGEAEAAFTRKIKSGKSPSISMAEVANEMSLNRFEANELVGRIKKQTKPIEAIIEEPITPDSDPKSFSLYFENVDDCDAATRILMDKRIAWATKGSQDDRSYIQFADHAGLSEAQQVLRRKWDFVENHERKVAQILFDNLQDYNRVLEFMRRQGTLIEFDSQNSLDEDYDELLNQHSVARKMAEKEGREFNDDFSETNIFTARPKIINHNEKIDPISETKFRVAKVRKRWR
jgi:hypothetical protein